MSNGNVQNALAGSGPSGSWFPCLFTCISSLKLKYIHLGWRTQTNICHTKFFFSLKIKQNSLATLWTGFRDNEIVSIKSYCTWNRATAISGPRGKESQLLMYSSLQSTHQSQSCPSGGWHHTAVSAQPSSPSVTLSPAHKKKFSPSSLTAASF